MGNVDVGLNDWLLLTCVVGSGPLFHFLYELIRN